MKIPSKKSDAPSKPSTQKNTVNASRLPHERDESEDSQASGTRKVIKQAYDDIERGLVDTSRGGTQSMDEREITREEPAPVKNKQEENAQRDLNRKG